MTEDCLPPDPELPVPKSFAADIQPLFRAHDITCMAGQGVMLDDANFMCDPAGDTTFADHANAREVHARLTDADSPMPPDGAWPADRIATYEAWMSDGFQR